VITLSLPEVIESVPSFFQSYESNGGGQCAVYGTDEMISC